MTRRIQILACLLVIALALLGLQSWNVALGRIERHVIAGITERVGLTVTDVERAEIALLPLPRISLSNVTFKQQDGAISGKALRLRARARLLSLISGSLSFDRIELIGPELEVAQNSEPDAVTDWVAAPLAGLERLRNQSRIIITAGSVFARAGGTISSVIRDVNLVIEERETTDPLLLSGTLNWRGVPATINLNWPMACEQARVGFSATSELIALRFDGMRSGPQDPVINGRLAFTTRALPNLLDWFGTPPRIAAAIGRFGLEADAQIRPRDVSLSNAKVSLDSDKLDGALKLTETGGRWALAGTLAGASLDLGRPLARLDPPLPAPGTGKITPLEFETWTAHDIDLRVSVDAARLHGARLGDVATYLLVKKGRFEAGLLRANTYGGGIKGRLLAVTAPNGTDVKFSAGLDRVNLGQASSDVPELSRLSGTTQLQLTLDGIGNTIEEVISSLNGKGNATLRQGDIAGFSALDLLRRAERNPLAALREWRQGRTAFESASAAVSVAGGLATISDIQMTGPAYRLALSGHASLPDRWIDLGGALTPASGTLRIPLALKGALGAPDLSPDTDAALRHSGAPLVPAAPTR